MQARCFPPTGPKRSPTGEYYVGLNVPRRASVFVVEDGDGRTQGRGRGRNDAGEARANTGGSRGAGPAPDAERAAGENIQRSLEDVWRHPQLVSPTRPEGQSWARDLTGRRDLGPST